MSNWFGKPLKHIPEPCSNCGEYQLELYENGKLICKRCWGTLEKQESENKNTKTLEKEIKCYEKIMEKLL